MKFLAMIMMVCSVAFVNAQTTAHIGGVKADKNGASAKGAKGGEAHINQNGAAAKSSSGKGVEANKKGLDVKGSKGGMTIDKKKLEIKSKNVHVHVGKQ
jgi:hypothetical protein